MVLSYKSSTRLLSLDVFRGITTVLMIIVNSPGNQTAFIQLQHSTWHGCTLADIIFPFFIIIVGISSVLTLAKQQAQGRLFGDLISGIAKRTAILFCLGLLLNILTPGIEWSTFRYLGVLQRIALCYFFTSWLYLSTRTLTQVLLVILILLSYWQLLLPGLSIESSLYLLTPENNINTTIDSFIIPVNHLYRQHLDPEGVLSTLPAIASALIGNLVGIFLLSHGNPVKKMLTMIAMGLGMGISGWFWGYFFPFNKTLWSSSYVLWTAGLALLAYACCYWLIEIKQWRRWAKCFELFGTHALMAYILHVLFLKIQIWVTVPTAAHVSISLKLAITHLFFSAFSLKVASLLYALSYTFLWLVVLVFVSNKNKGLSVN